jgi:hypothetical protein
VDSSGGEGRRAIETNKTKINLLRLTYALLSAFIEPGGVRTRWGLKWEASLLQELSGVPVPTAPSVNNQAESGADGEGQRPFVVLLREYPDKKCRAQCDGLSTRCLCLTTHLAVRTA